MTWWSFSRPLRLNSPSRGGCLTYKVSILLKFLDNPKNWPHGDGIEQIYGSSLADLLIGDGGANTLWGSGGNEILRGGLGADVLKGGAGNDSFVYAGLLDSTVAVSGRDLAADFTVG